VEACSCVYERGCAVDIGFEDGCGDRVGESLNEGVRAKKRAGSPTLSLQLKLERFRWDDER